MIVGLQQSRSWLQLYDRNELQELQECTFKPKLVTQRYQRELDQVNVILDQEQQEVSRRCNNWLRHTSKKKENARKQAEQDRLKECTFEPFFLSKKYRKRACSNPLYADPPKYAHDMASKANDIENELEFFTLQNYLLNDQSRQNLSQLYEKYKSETPSKSMTREIQTNKRSHRINDFLERSKKWQQRVQIKNQALKEEVECQEREKQPFHPKINFISSCLHQEKIRMLKLLHQSKQIQQFQTEPMAYMASSHSDIEMQSQLSPREIPQQLFYQQSDCTSTQGGEVTPRQIQQKESDLSNYYLPQRRLAKIIENTRSECILRLQEKKLELDQRLSQQSQQFESRKQSLEFRDEQSMKNESALQIYSRGSMQSNKELATSQSGLTVVDQAINFNMEQQQVVTLMEALQQKLTSSELILPQQQDAMLQPQIIRGPSKSYGQLTLQRDKNQSIPIYQETHETQQTEDSNQLEEDPSSTYRVCISEIQNDSLTQNEPSVIYETAAWAYNLPGQVDNLKRESSQPPEVTDYGPIQQYQNHIAGQDSMQSSLYKTLSQRTDETSHFNNSGKTLVTYGDVVGKKSLLLQTQSQESKELTLGSLTTGNDGQHRPTPTLTDPVIRASRYQICNVNAETQTETVQDQVKTLSEEEPDSYPLSHRDPEPKPVLTKFSETDEHIFSSTDDKNSRLVASDAKYVTPLCQQQSPDQHASQKKASKRPKKSKKSPTPQKSNRQFIDQRNLVTTKSIQDLAEFCRKVEAQSQERKSSRNSRRSGSYSDTKSNNSRQSTNFSPFRAKRNPKIPKKRDNTKALVKQGQNKPCISIKVDKENKLQTRQTLGPSQMTVCSQNSLSTNVAMTNDQTTTHAMTTFENHTVNLETAVCSSNHMLNQKTDNSDTISLQADSFRILNFSSPPLTQPQAPTLRSDNRFQKLSSKLKQLKNRNH